MRTKQLLIAAAFVASTVSSAFAGWTTPKTIKALSASVNNGEVYVSLDNDSKAYHNGAWRDKVYFVKHNDSIATDAEKQRMLDLLNSALENDKTVQFGIVDGIQDYFGNPGYEIRTINVNR